MDARRSSKEDEQVNKQIRSLTKDIKRTQHTANRHRAKGSVELRKVQNLDDDFPFHKHEDPLHPSDHSRSLSHTVHEEFEQADELDDKASDLREKRDKLLSRQMERHAIDESDAREERESNKDLDKQKRALEHKDDAKLRKFKRRHPEAGRRLPDLTDVEIKAIQMEAENMAFEEHYLQQLASGGGSGKLSKKQSRKGK